MAILNWLKPVFVVYNILVNDIFGYKVYIEATQCSLMSDIIWLLIGLNSVWKGIDESKRRSLLLMFQDCCYQSG